MVRLTDIIKSTKKTESVNLREKKQKPEIITKEVQGEIVEPPTVEVISHAVEIKPATGVEEVEEVKETIHPEKEKTISEDRKDSREDLAPANLYDEAIKLMTKYWKSASSGAKINIAEAEQLIAKIVDDLKDSNKLLNLANTPQPSPEDFMVFNSTNVCILSIRIGMGLDYDRDELIDLGLCAYLHDIGLSKLPDANIINKKETYSDDEFEMIKKHPEDGYEIIKQAEPEYRWIADVIIQEHERERGQGYPRGLARKEIHEYAKIIGLVDVYEALIHPRPHKRSLIPYEALKHIIHSRNEEFSPELIKVLINEISLFPINSYVKLNTNEIGKVVDINRSNPLRPKIAILFDEKGNELRKPKVIDLLENPFVYITGPIAG